MRPPFLQLREEENFADYQREFGILLPSTLTDILGNQVIFTPDRCQHVCYKSTDEKWNKGFRTQWVQDRAERIPWIKAALQSPNFIRIDTGKTWAYLLEVTGDAANKLSPELYLVIVDASRVTPDTRGTVYFVTGYPINFNKWNNFKKNRPWIYPKEVKVNKLQNKK